MSKFAEWLVTLIKSLFEQVWTFLGDIAIWFLGQVLTAITQAFNLILVPCFMSVSSALSLSSSLAKVPDFVWFFAVHLDLAGCFKILSCAIIFVFARKLITLFQW